MAKSIIKGKKYIIIGGIDYHGFKLNEVVECTISSTPLGNISAFKNKKITQSVFNYYVKPYKHKKKLNLFT